MYDTPARHEVTIYRVTVTGHGQVDPAGRSRPCATTRCRRPASRSPSCPRAELAGGAASPTRSRSPTTAGSAPLRHRAAGPAQSSRWARSGANAGRQTATYSRALVAGGVADPLAGPGDHGLTRRHLEHAAVVLDPHRPAQHDA